MSKDNKVEMTGFDDRMLIMRRIASRIVLVP